MNQIKNNKTQVIKIQIKEDNLVDILPALQCLQHKD